MKRVAKKYFVRTDSSDIDNRVIAFFRKRATRFENHKKYFFIASLCPHFFFSNFVHLFISHSVHFYLFCDVLWFVHNTKLGIRCPYWKSPSAIVLLSKITVQFCSLMVNLLCTTFSVSFDTGVNTRYCFQFRVIRLLDNLLYFFHLQQWNVAQ